MMISQRGSSFTDKAQDIICGLHMLFPQVDQITNVLHTWYGIA